MVNLELRLGKGKVEIPLGEGAFSARALPFIELDEVIGESLETLYSLGVVSKQLNENLYIAENPNEILEVMNLRSRVYGEYNYEAFKDKIPGYNFDDFDRKSINVIFKRKGDITGSTRIVCDSKNLGVPTEGYYPKKSGLFNELRKKYDNYFLPIAELSRTVIDSRFRKSGREFKEMFAGLYYLGLELDVGSYVLSMAKEMYEKLYLNSGMNVLGYENQVNGMKVDCVILNWNPRESTDSFKECFLRKSKREVYN